FDVDIKKVFVAGEDINQDFISQLKKGLDKEYKLIDIQIKGMSDEMINEYLIPLSLQFKKAVEPSDPSTINLLPAFLVDQYREKRLRLQVWGATLTFTLFTWVTFLAVIAVYLLLSQQIMSEKS